MPGPGLKKPSSLRGHGGRYSMASSPVTSGGTDDRRPGTSARGITGVDGRA